MVGTQLLATNTAGPQNLAKIGIIEYIVLLADLLEA